MTEEKPHKTGHSEHCTIAAYHYTEIVDGGEEMCSTCSVSNAEFKTLS